MPTRAPQPYQVLFPLGALHAIAGTLAWVLFALGVVVYPGAFHAQAMIPGFLFSFAAGFLMTAVPRFTGAQAASALELAIATVLCASILPLQAIAPGSAISFAATAAVPLFLLSFFAARFRRRAFSLPRHFVLIPAGLAMGAIGALMLALVAGGALDAQWVVSARTLLYVATMSCLTLGIGSKLVTALLGRGPSMLQIEPLRPTAAHLLARWTPEIQCGLIVGSFVLDVIGQVEVARATRAAVAIWIGFGRWQLHRAPAAEGRLARWLWVAAWMTVLGFVLAAIWPSGGPHALHLLYVGGLGMMTLMVASRVVLAHGGYDVEIEERSRTFPWLGGLLLLAGATRLAAPFSASYTHHLAYASLVWIAGIVLWLKEFAPRIVRGAEVAHQEPELKESESC